METPLWTSTSLPSTTLRRRRDNNAIVENLVTMVRFWRRTFSSSSILARKNGRASSRRLFFCATDTSVPCVKALSFSLSLEIMKCRSEIARGTHRATSMHRKCADNSVILLRLRSTVEPYERNPHPQAHPEHLCRGIGRSSHQSRESAPSNSPGNNPSFRKLDTPSARLAFVATKRSRAT